MHACNNLLSETKINSFLLAKKLTLSSKINLSNTKICSSELDRLTASMSYFHNHILEINWTSMSEKEITVFLLRKSLKKDGGLDTVKTKRISIKTMLSSLNSKIKLFTMTTWVNLLILATKSKWQKT